MNILSFLSGFIIGVLVCVFLITTVSEEYKERQYEKTKNASP